MTKNELINRYDNASNTIKEILTLNYNKIIMEAEIDECVDPVIKKNKDYLNKQISRYSRWWIGILVAFVLSFVIANQVFAPDTELITNKDSTKVLIKSKLTKTQKDKSDSSLVSEK